MSLKLGTTKNSDGSIDKIFFINEHVGVDNKLYFSKKTNNFASVSETKIVGYSSIGINFNKIEDFEKFISDGSFDLNLLDDDDIKLIRKIIGKS